MQHLHPIRRHAVPIKQGISKDKPSLDAFCNPSAAPVNSSQPMLASGTSASTTTVSRLQPTQATTTSPAPSGNPSVILSPGLDKRDKRDKVPGPRQSPPAVRQPDAVESFLAGAARIGYLPDAAAWRGADAAPRRETVNFSSEEDATIAAGLRMLAESRHHRQDKWSAIIQWDAANGRVLSRRGRTAIDIMNRVLRTTTTGHSAAIAFAEATSRAPAHVDARERRCW
jgi:hypothetical protein